MIEGGGGLILILYMLFFEQCLLVSSLKIQKRRSASVRGVIIQFHTLILVFTDTTLTVIILICLLWKLIIALDWGWGSLLIRIFAKLNFNYNIN